MAIRSRHAQYTGRSGGPADLDEAVRLCREEWHRCRDGLGADHYWSQSAAADLATALRERGGTEDLVESLRILRGQISQRHHQYGGDHPFTCTAKAALAHTLVSLAELDGGAEAARYATEAAEITGMLADLRRDYLGRDDAASLRAHLIHAHAQILLGDPRGAIREIRYVKAVARRTGICPGEGWADSLIAKAEAASVAAPVPAALGVGHLRTG